MLRVSTEGPILVIELNRPARRNAIDRGLADAVSSALDQLEQDPGLRAGILTGGPRWFCAGTDLHEDVSPATDSGGEYGVVRRVRRKPLIAAVEGVALGGGLELVLACDLVVAGRSATFGLPEVTRGVVPSCGALFRAPARIPRVIAHELLLTGSAITASRAFEVGLVNAVVDDGAAVTEAVLLGRRIVANSPAAIAATLAALSSVERVSEDAGWEATAAAVAEAGTSPDRAEGIRAFFEKRPPRWLQE